MKKITTIACAVAVIGAFSVGTSTASAASFTLPKLPAITLPAGASGVLGAAKTCASQKSVQGVVSCLVAAVKPALPKGISIPSTSSITSQLGGLNLSSLTSALKGINLGSLSGLLGGLIK